MKKVGIVTLYYKSINYGGNLQAYALCEFLNKNGYDAEQICFTTTTEKKESFFSKIKRIFSVGIGRFFSLLKRKLSSKNVVLDNNGNDFIEEKKQVKELMKKRAEAFKSFNIDKIPHSEKLYYSDTINETQKLYDCFITGSDQVWNFRSYNPIYFLDFVPKNKIKLSYAASFSMDSLENWQKKVLKKSLKSFKAVSVREESTLRFLDNVSCAQKENVLDPTFLLEAEDWDRISAERLIDEDYVFCYFLGDNKNERLLAKQFAEEKNLKLVTIPHAGGGMRVDDFTFGDVQFGIATPQEFISLIKHSSYVFTDSFHAVVFSQMYKKQFFVFNRNHKKEMTSRIKDLTALYGTQNRYCCDESLENIEYLLKAENIDYDKQNGTIDVLKKKSKDFLLKNLGA